MLELNFVFQFLSDNGVVENMKRCCLQGECLSLFNVHDFVNCTKATASDHLTNDVRVDLSIGMGPQKARRNVCCTRVHLMINVQH